MTAEIILIARARQRCAVCGGRSTENNRFGMRTDADGKDVFLHLNCLLIWTAWQRANCLFCGGRPDNEDMLRVFAGSIEPDGWIHARCRGGYVALCREEFRVPCSEAKLEKRKY